MLKHIVDHLQISHRSSYAEESLQIIGRRQSFANQLHVTLLMTIRCERRTQPSERCASRACECHLAVDRGGRVKCIWCEYGGRYNCRQFWKTFGAGGGQGWRRIVISGSYAFINYYENYNDAAFHVHALWEGGRMGWSQGF